MRHWLIHSFSNLILAKALQEFEHRLQKKKDARDEIREKKREQRNQDRANMLEKQKRRNEEMDIKYDELMDQGK